MQHYVSPYYFSLLECFSYHYQHYDHTIFKTFFFTLTTLLLSIMVTAQNMDHYMTLAVKNGENIRLDLRAASANTFVR